MTVLFADMAGFTAIPERLGEDGAFVLIQPIYELMAGAVGGGNADRRWISPATASWRCSEPSRTGLDFGTNWIFGSATALLIVPSVIVPEEFNVLINPVHADAAGIAARKVRKWTYDPRLLKA